MSDQHELEELFRRTRVAATPTDATSQRVLRAVLAAPPAPGGSAVVRTAAGIVVLFAAYAGWHALDDSRRETLPPPEPMIVVREQPVVRAVIPTIEPERDVDPTGASIPPPIPPPQRPSRYAGPHEDEELSLLVTAKRTLDRGDPTRALDLLASHQTRFPTSMLGQERLVLQARALCKTGQVAEAKRLFAYLKMDATESPHIASLRRACSALEED